MSQMKNWLLEVFVEWPLLVLGVSIVLLVIAGVLAVPVILVSHAIWLVQRLF